MSWGVATQNGVSVSIASVVSLSSGATQFSPADLFTGGVVGAWYDPSDLTTLFQDSAGTTPVTAVEQPVGKMLDKSGNNNHATQATSLSRPTYSARYNLLTYSEQFDNAAWTKNNATITANSIVAPDGTTTADTMIPANGTFAITASGAQQIKESPGNKTLSVSAKLDSARYLALGFSNGGGFIASAIFDLQTASVVASNVHPSVGTSLTTTILSQGSGWYRCSVTLVGNLGVALYNHICVGTAYAPSGYGYNLTGNGTASSYVWGAQLFAGSIAGTYQRIAAATSYNATGFLPYLAFDGTDDSMATGSINFTGGDSMFVCAGLSKLSDLGTGVFVELSAAADVNNGAFSLRAPTGGAAIYQALSRGTNNSTSTPSASAPDTAVISLTFVISTDTNIFRRNGTQVASATADQGTGNYGNYPLYIGRRGGTTLSFNGRMYSLIIAAKAASAGDITNTEAWVNQRTGAY